MKVSSARTRRSSRSYAGGDHQLPPAVTTDSAIGSVSANPKRLATTARPGRHGAVADTDYARTERRAEAVLHLQRGPDAKQGVVGRCLGHDLHRFVELPDAGAHQHRAIQQRVGGEFQHRPGQDRLLLDRSGGPRGQQVMELDGNHRIARPGAGRRMVRHGDTRTGQREPRGWCRSRRQSRKRGMRDLERCGHRPEPAFCSQQIAPRAQERHHAFAHRIDCGYRGHGARAPPRVLRASWQDPAATTNSLCERTNARRRSVCQPSGWQKRWPCP